MSGLKCKEIQLISPEILYERKSTAPVQSSSKNLNVHVDSDGNACLNALSIKHG